MKITLIFISFFSFTIGFSQNTSMFKETNSSLANHFVNSEILREAAISDRYEELTRTEGFVVNEITTLGSVFTKKLHRSGKVIFDCPAGNYLNQIKSNLLNDYPEIDKLINIYVTEDPSLNAFATVNNNIYVNVGLLSRVENEAQLAFILSHEIMHIVDAHIIDGTLKMNREAKTFNKSNVSIDNDLFQLYRHEMSRGFETEADIDGFTLFLKSNYDPNEGVTALQLLSIDDGFIRPIELSKQLFFMNAAEYDTLINNYTSNLKNSKKKDEIDTLLQTHPLISVRIEKMLELMKTVESNEKKGNKYIISENDFTKVKQEASRLVNNLYAEDLDFASLFLNASSRLTSSNDFTEENLNYLGYSLQGLLIDRFKKFNIGASRSINVADSVFSYFYKSSSLNEFSKWTYSIIDSLNEIYKSPSLKSYEMAITLAIVNEELDSLETIFGDDISGIDTKASKNINGLDIEKLEFEISPFSDMSIFKVAKFNEYQKHTSKIDGKLAIANLNVLHVRKNAPIYGNFIIDIAKTEELERRSDEVCDNLEEDYDGKVISLIPNSKDYSGIEYNEYDVLNQWMNERLYFNNYFYKSIHDADVINYINSEEIKYVMSSFNVEIKSFSMKNFIGVYFSPFFMPAYLPQLIAHIVNSSTRKYQLSLIYDVQTGALTFWDKRTYLDPNSIGQMQMIYNDVLNTFFHE